MSEALKPCPFCGGQAEFERKGTARHSTIITCTNCGATLETGAEWDHEREWNERPADKCLGQIEAGLSMLQRAIQDGDPHTELLVRVSDIRKELASLRSPGQGGE
jgi:Lar family restriction alleviation protein